MATQFPYPNMPMSDISSPHDFTGTSNLGIYTNDATQRYMIGTLYETWDGRRFRYAKIGAANIAAGLMMQAGVNSAKHIAIAQTGYPHAVGDTKIRCLVTTGGIAGSETFAQTNAISGGFVSFYTDGTPSSAVQSYQVLSSVMISETVIELELTRPISTAVAATEYVILTPNKYFKTVVAPATTLTAQPVGVPVVPLTANYFGWLQTKGPCPMQMDTGDTAVIGSIVGVPATNAIAGTAGVTTATAFAFPIYGRVLQLGAADKYGIIDLMLE